MKQTLIQTGIGTFVEGIGGVGAYILTHRLHGASDAVSHIIHGPVYALTHCPDCAVYLLHRPIYGFIDRIADVFPKIRKIACVHRLLHLIPDVFTGPIPLIPVHIPRTLHIHPRYYKSRCFPD